MVLVDDVLPLVRLWVATLSECDITLRRWLDDRELERIERYQGQADKARFLLGAAMVRAAAGLELGIPPQNVRVHRGCTTCGGWHGPPTVQGTALQLSVSHSGLVVALALARGTPVGIDVERVEGARAGSTTWTRAEARFKAGGDPRLVVQDLAAPFPGHVMCVATDPEATVQVRPWRELRAGL